MDSSFSFRLLYRYYINKSKISKKEKKKYHDHLDAWNEWCIIQARSDLWITFPVIIVLMPIAIPRHLYLEAKARKVMEKVLYLGEKLNGKVEGYHSV